MSFLLRLSSYGGGDADGGHNERDEEASAVPARRVQGGDTRVKYIRAESRNPNRMLHHPVVGDAGRMRISPSSLHLSLRRFLRLHTKI